MRLALSSAFWGALGALPVAGLVAGGSTVDVLVVIPARAGRDSLVLAVPLMLAVCGLLAWRLGRPRGTSG